MSILSDRIDLLCKKNGITGYRLCKDIGISPNVMTELRSGRREGISAKNANKIAEYFGVSVGYLLGDGEKEKPAGQKADGLDELEDDLIKAFRRLPDQMKESLLRKIQADAEFYGLPPKD